ncbi:hypothetical protein [Pseudomonas alabamensis]|uniref:hypothetical protein n=1 Tax=Pseudomonas alabamensis TaxID=3064349 RepID=UPI0021D98340|nr:hypothetical protein [Pseudomonas entomophila]
MFDEADIRQFYSDVETHADHYFFQLRLAETFDDHCLKSTPEKDLLVISEAIVDRAFAMDVIRQASGDFSQDRVSKFDLTANPYGFTQALVLPNTYHGAFKGRFDAKRERLYLCVPIHRCEFSGDESADEFKAMLERTVYPFRWNRPVSPKIRVYFDNPVTGAGTDEGGVLMTYSTVLSEIGNLNGVVNGFIEITNYAGDVIEVLSPGQDQFTLIRHRSDETAVSLPQLMDALNRFVFDGQARAQMDWHGSVV